MSNRTCVIIGGGGHASCLAEILKADQLVKLLGYTDINPTLFMSTDYLGDDSILEEYKSVGVELVNGIGSVGLPQLREQVYLKLVNQGYYFTRVIHPSVIMAPSVMILDGVQLLPGVIISTGVRIESNVIVNTGSQIDHHSTIGAHSHIAPGANICGEVTIGQGVHVGAGATIIQGVTIGDGALIAAGAVVTADVKPHHFVKGVPAR